MRRPTDPSRSRWWSIRSARRSIVVLALAALVLSQLLLGIGAVAAQAAAPVPPCHLGMEMPAVEHIPSGAHDDQASAHGTAQDKTGKAALPHCPMMVGVSCLSLCATGPAFPPALVLPRSVAFYGPLPQAQLASRTDAPPLPPPRSL